jgi:sugar phosphate isomerase/epimerase
MKLGISSYTYTWAIGVPGYPVADPLSALGLLEKATALGVSVLQIADNLPLDALNDAEITALVEKASDCDIQIEVGARGIWPTHLNTYLNLALRLDSPIVRVVIDTADHHPSVSEVITLLRQSLPAYEDAEISLAVENHDRFSIKDFTRVLETIDSPYLGICLDTVNSFGALEGPKVVLNTLGPWTINLHIKDFSIRRADHMMGFMIEGTPAGQGRLDIPWLLEKLTKYGVTYNAILELWTPPEPEITATIVKEELWCKESVHYLRTLIRD